MCGSPKLKKNLSKPGNIQPFALITSEKRRMNIDNLFDKLDRTDLENVLRGLGMGPQFDIARTAVTNEKAAYAFMSAAVWGAYESETNWSRVILALTAMQSDTTLRIWTTNYLNNDELFKTWLVKTGRDGEVMKKFEDRLQADSAAAIVKRLSL